MKITIPTTSTKLVDILSTTQVIEIRKQRNDIHHPVLLIEPAGTIWWTIMDDNAAVDECLSIKADTLGKISIENGLQEINNLKFIASVATTINIEVVSEYAYTNKNSSTASKQDDQITALNTIADNTDTLEAKLDTLETDKATESKQEDIITAINGQGSLSTLKTTTVTLTTADTAYQLPETEQADRRSIILYNASDTDMYYGDSNVTTSNGILLASGAEVSLDISTNLYAVCGTDSKTINILELK